MNDQKRTLTRRKLLSEMGGRALGVAAIIASANTAYGPRNANQRTEVDLDTYADKGLPDPHTFLSSLERTDDGKLAIKICPAIVKDSEEFHALANKAEAEYLATEMPGYIDNINNLSFLRSISLIITLNQLNSDLPNLEFRQVYDPEQADLILLSGTAEKRMGDGRLVAPSDYGAVTLAITPVTLKSGDRKILIVMNERNRAFPPDQLPEEGKLPSLMMPFSVQQLLCNILQAQPAEISDVIDAELKRRDGLKLSHSAATRSNSSGMSR